MPPDRVIVSPAARRAVVLDAIRGATRRLSLSLFRCNDKEVFTALAGAAARGVTVEVLVTSRARGGKKKLRKLWHRLEETGATVHAYDDPVVKYHAKYLVADEGPAIVASLNFTRKCFEHTCDALVVTHDAQVIDGLRQLMSADQKGGAAVGVTERLILGPERARRQYKDLLAQAQSSIWLIDRKLSDPAMLTLLDERRKAGVDVRVHRDTKVGGLRAHGRILLLDGRRAVVGSIALTALSLDFRREVAIEVTEPAAVREIEALFRSIGIEAPAAAEGSATAPAAAAIAPAPPQAS